MAPSVTRSAEGVVLDDKKNWVVGKKIGSGVQGTVHEVLANGAVSEFAVKLAPVPTVKTKGRQLSPAQQNANAIYRESVVYQNALGSLKGTFIPKVASPQAFKEVSGKCPNFCNVFLDF
jgi:hypothetical protein